MAIENIPNKNTNEFSLSSNVKKQLDNLGLSVDMVRGNILDVGAGDAEFARAFAGKKEAKITSVDRNPNKENDNFVIVADSRSLPFPDNSYDMVISHASIPHIFLDLYSFDFPEGSLENIRSAIARSFSEILRVLKEGKKAYMAPIGIGYVYDSEKTVKKAIFEELENLKKMGIHFEFEFIETYENPDNKEITDLFRLIIQKPEKNR